MTAALFVVGMVMVIIAAFALFAFSVYVVRSAGRGRFRFRAGCQPLGITAEGEIDTR